MNEVVKTRRVRSFVRREGRLTSGQQRAIETLWAEFGIDSVAGPLDLDSLFGRSAPRILEIGFGNGQSLVAMAQAYPDMDHLGIEVHRPGIGHLLIHAEALALTNLRVMYSDAVEVLKHQLPDTSLDRIQIFFPDPWPKKRHHKRRLIQPDFASLLARKLKPGASLYLTTDWEDYALHMLKVLEAADGLVNTAGSSRFAPRPNYRPTTKFERRGERLGHQTWNLIFERSN